MDYEIRRLTGDDAEIFRAVRLESLELHPEAFGASFEVESEMALTEVAARLDNGTVFGGFDGADLVGIAGFLAFAAPKTRHRGMLWGLYVKQAARGGGLATILVERVLDHAKSEVELVQLVVETTNRSAIRLYDKMGFERYGLDRRALKVGDRYVDAELRVRFLD